MNRNTSVVYILIDEGISFDDLRRYLCHISVQRRERIKRYLLEQDQINSLIAALLVRWNVRQSLGLANRELSFCYQKLGKPCLMGHAGYHFSISHADHCVAFACGDTPIGVDVERISDPEIAVTELCFVSGELEYFQKSYAQNIAFYKIWTQKEAYIKMLGTGLSTPLSSFDVTSAALRKILRSWNRSGYWISVCSRSLEGGDGNSDYTPSFERLNLQVLLDSFDCDD